LGADYFIRQHELLVDRDSNLPDLDTWLKENTATANKIDDEIRKAYQASGKQYLVMATISTLDSVVQYPDLREYYQYRAMKCLARAGWDEDKIKLAVARIDTRHYKPMIKNHIRNKIAAKEKADDGKIDTILAKIDYEGNEAKARDMLTKKYYARYVSEATQMVEHVSDPYYTLKARKALLADIERTLKETHDLLMVKYHHVRDIQGLLVLLSQQEAMVASLRDEERQRIEEIGQRVAHKPEMVGIHDKTLAHVQSAFDTNSAQVYGHVMQTLAEQQVPSTLHKTSNSTAIQVALPDMEKMFERWQQREEGRKPARAAKEVSPHLYPWLAQVAGKLFLQPDVVQSVDSINTHDAAITCEMKLSRDLEVREIQWRQLRKAVYGFGIAMPPMPLDGAELHTIRLPIYSRTRRREDRLGHASEALHTFAVSEGMTPRAAQSMVDRARASAREPRALRRALARAGDKADAVREVLER
jgi:hypothetical protein